MKSSIILFFCLGILHAQSPHTPPSGTYHTAHYETGGHIRVVRDRELGTAAQQAAVGRVAGPARTMATEAAQRSQQHTVARQADVVAFRLVHTARHHFDQTTYHMQDDGLAVVLRVTDTPTEDTRDPWADVAAEPAPVRHTGSSPATLSAYPNPVATPGIITLEVPEGTGCTFRLQDAQGRTVHTQALPQDTYTVPLAQLPAGVYLFTVESGAFRQVGRLVVQ